MTRSQRQALRAIRDANVGKEVMEILLTQKSSSAGDEEEDFTQQQHLSGIFPHCCEGFAGQRAWKVQEYYVNRSSKLRENIFIEPTGNYQQHI